MQRILLYRSDEIRIYCVYSVVSKDGSDVEETFGMLYYAEIFSFEKELYSEIEKIVIMEEEPEAWTYRGH